MQKCVLSYFLPVIALIAVSCAKPGVETTVLDSVNGKVEDPKLWPGIVKIVDADGKHCTGTLVSKNTLLTAAHCVDQNKQSPAKVNDVFFTLMGKIYPYECTITPEYAAAGSTDGSKLRDDRDVALCKAIRPLPKELIEQHPFEVMEIMSDLEVGLDLLVGGYGCTEKVDKPASKYDYKLDGELRLGETTINDIQTGKIDSEGIPLTYFKSVSWADDSKTDICAGDSGGAAFLITKGRSLRTIVGVNSGARREPTQRSPGDIVDQRFSQYADLTDADIVQFINNWISANPNQQICGINVEGNSNGCRF